MANELFTGRVDAEQSVLGSMLFDDRCIPLVLRKMRPEDFTHGTCRSTFRAIQKLVREGKPVDPVTVVDAMSGGETYIRWIRELLEATPTAANVEAYIDIAQRGAALYHLREYADKILLCTDLEEAQANVRKMSSLLSATSRMPRMTAAELAQDFLERMKAPRPEYLPWGFPTADKEAFAELGDFILLGGYPSAGKTLASKIIEEVGEENVCTFQTDLTTLDGLKPYPVLESKISLPTFDFYRANVSVFDQYPVDDWWWLATPESAQPHCSPLWASCVSPSGIFSDNVDCDGGVRPILIFDSSIFGSSDA